MRNFREWHLDDLMAHISTEERGVPVRALEAVLAHGEAAVAPLLAVLEESGDTEEEDNEPRFWPIVLLGELRHHSAAPALADIVREAGPDDIALSFAAAEALAKIGSAALPELRSLATSGAWRHRLWAYYAAGGIDDDASFAWLISMLESDPEMADIVALALSDQGRAEAVGPIVRALETAEPAHRPDLEDALVHLHGLSPEIRDSPKDWRLRHRWQPGIGFFPLHWVTISAIVGPRDTDRLGRDPQPLRPLDEILATARAEGPDLCECCNIPTWIGTGVPVCPEIAATVPILQARHLEQLAEEELVGDLFELLDELDDRFEELEEGPRCESGAARRRREDTNVGLKVLRSGCLWLIERGVETVEAGVARLHREAALAAKVHGSPLPTPPAMASEPAGTRVGRNEPCPCGSGRKFKRCCAVAGG